MICYEVIYFFSSLNRQIITIAQCTPNSESFQNFIFTEKQVLPLTTQYLINRQQLRLLVLLQTQKRMFPKFLLQQYNHLPHQSINKSQFYGVCLEKLQKQWAGRIRNLLIQCKFCLLFVIIVFHITLNRQFLHGRLLILIFLELHQRLLPMKSRNLTQPEIKQLPTKFVRREKKKIA